MIKHVYYTEDFELESGKDINICYNMDNDVTDPLGIDDQYTFQELKVIASNLNKFIRNIEKDKKNGRKKD